MWRHFKRKILCKRINIDVQRTFHFLTSRIAFTILANLFIFRWKTLKDTKQFSWASPVFRFSLVFPAIFCWFSFFCILYSKRGCQGNTSARVPRFFLLSYDYSSISPIFCNGKDVATTQREGRRREWWGRCCDSCGGGGRMGRKQKTWVSYNLFLYGGCLYKRA